MDENKGGIIVLIGGTTICVVENDILSDSESGHYDCELGFISFNRSRYTSRFDIDLLSQGGTGTGNNVEIGEVETARLIKLVIYGRRWKDLHKYRLAHFDMCKNQNRRDQKYAQETQNKNLTIQKILLCGLNLHLVSEAEFVFF